MSFLSRRTPRTPSRVLTAAGQRVDLTASRPQKRARERWQADAWHYRDGIGEIRYSMGFLKYAASRVRLVPALAQEDGTPPVPLAEAEGVPPAVVTAANDALSRLTSGTFNYAELLAPYAENLEVAGECWLVGWTDADGVESWQIRSIDEVEVSDRGYRFVDSPNGKDGRVLDADTSFVARLWTPHPKWSALPDSPMRALLEPCEELALVGRLIRQASRSRLAGAGILFVDNSLDFASTADAAVDDPDSDPFLTELTRAMLAPVQDEGDASAIVPILIRGSIGDGRRVEDLIRKIDLGQVVPDKLLERQEKALARIGAGLDVPPEIVTGMAGVNHWTAWQVDDSTIRNHVEPLVIRMCDGFTAGYLRAVLPEYQVPVEWARRVVCWYDLSAVTVKSNRAEDAQTGHTAGVLSDRVLVEALGFDPDVDMPDEDELMRRLALRRGQMDGSITEALLRQLLLPILDNVRHMPPGQVTVHAGQDAQDAEAANPPALPPGPSAPEPAPTPTPDAPAPADDDGPTTPQPDGGLPAVAAAADVPVMRAYVPESRRLADIDRVLRERLTTAVEAAVARAVERASNRVRTQANRDPAAKAVVSAVEGRQAAKALGPGMVAGLGLDPAALFAGAWDDLARLWLEWTSAAAARAAAITERITGRPTTGTVEAALAQQQSDGWAWMERRLDEHALAVLYDPDDTDGVQDGEDPGPRGAAAGLARGALALAGGVPASSGGISDDGLPVQSGTRLGGIATGDTYDGALRDSGQQVIGYEWVYGISQRHFKPHRDLDGTLFPDFNSPRLTNRDSWPPGSSYAPGDHAGCHCDAMPVYADGPAAVGVDHATQAAPAADYLGVLRDIAAADLAAGLTDTDTIRTVAEADRIAQARPSRR